MKNRKILRNITIIISIIVVMIDIALYIKLSNSFDTFSNLGNSIDRAGGLIGILFYFGTFVWGVIALIILWIQYFLIVLIVKVFNKLMGIKKWILSSLLTGIILFLIIIGVRIFVFMSTMLFNYSNENTIKNETSEIRKNEVYFTAKEIFESVISKDAEKLKSFFKPSIKNKEKINNQIEEMLKFIDGNIVSYSDIKEGGGSKSKEYVTTVFEKNTYKVKDIKTDTGRTYTITYNIVEIDKDNSKDIGMDYIGIFDNDLYDSNDGYSYSGKYIISEEEVDIVETSNSKHIPRKFFDAVLNKDKEALKDFLTIDLQELEETNVQINKFFEFIDGEIESYSEPRSEIRFDTNNYRVFEGIVSNIKTNTGKNYEIEYEYIDGLGIYEIILMNSDVYDKRKGEPISARVYVGDKVT